MSRTPTMLWSVLAISWIAPIWRLAHTIGGFQWISHMGQTGPVLTAGVMIALCAVAAMATSFGEGLPGTLRWAVVIISTLHLVHAAYFFAFYSVNGHLPVGVLLPYLLLGSVFPSVIVTGSVPIIVALHVVLPVSCLALALLATRPRTASAEA